MRRWMVSYDPYEGLFFSFWLWQRICLNKIELLHYIHFLPLIQIKFLSKSICHRPRKLSSDQINLIKKKQHTHTHFAILNEMKRLTSHIYAKCSWCVEQKTNELRINQMNCNIKINCLALGKCFKWIKKVNKKISNCKWLYLICMSFIVNFILKISSIESSEILKIVHLYL